MSIFQHYLEHGQIPWMNRIRHALLTTVDVNVIQVDWGLGAGIPYEQATANTRMVGSQVGDSMPHSANYTAHPQYIGMALIHNDVISK